tara:strand:+ start:59 stop:346 length:288 start_codon:yes stop_codon:yes gene_type:complete
MTLSTREMFEFMEKDMEEERRAATTYSEHLLAEIKTLRQEKIELQRQLHEIKRFKISYIEVQNLKNEIKHLKEAYKQEFKMRVMKTRELKNNLKL